MAGVNLILMEGEQIVHQELTDHVHSLRNSNYVRWRDNHYGYRADLGSDIAMVYDKLPLVAEVATIFDLEDPLLDGIHK